MCFGSKKWFKEKKKNLSFKLYSNYREFITGDHCPAVRAEIPRPPSPQTLLQVLPGRPRGFPRSVRNVPCFHITSLNLYLKCPKQRKYGSSQTALLVHTSHSSSFSKNGICAWRNTAEEIKASRQHS